jgi:predicted SprT family Zn-dependent metalloprotease
MTLERARRLAEALMRQHKLLPQWSFVFDRSRVRFGRCHYDKRQISLSRFLVELNDEPEVRETILHEIAHALAPRGAGHGPLWKAVAQSIGASGQRCYGQDVQRPAAKYKATCPACRWVIYRHRRTKLSCGKCSPVFDSKYVFVWSV